MLVEESSMKLCHFPEKLFESMYNHCLCSDFSEKGTKANLWAPSQNGEAYAGYDALFINKDPSAKRKLIAIQYKVPTYEYKTSNKKKHILKGDFKFELHKNSKGKYIQNELLLKMQSSGVVDEVYYCAPLFTSCKQLNNYTRSNTLKNHCKLIKPVALTAKENHFCTYNEKGTPYFHSKNAMESQEIKNDDVFEDKLENKPLDTDRALRFKKFMELYGKELTDVFFYSF